MILYFTEVISKYWFVCKDNSNTNNDKNNKNINKYNNNNKNSI